ncbi:stage III sporulation protein AA [Halobacteroides halobius DSM 5150]|uniref:Stage III sporulation protein AA n=1 Tax=Halobacteroides halobius (strain ATCC 35273 / DSM 5150 / MD-1) TaxID=748449 RepID=L0K5F3_HALHC|nr:stage III sporulation protein AA [Halobacteroides halobius]AGB40507.1 stage III sporulation protein AA [Halobacteroides halobius DSM 5150]
MGTKNYKLLKQDILPVLAPSLRQIIGQVADRKLKKILEIRLRSNNPLLLEEPKGELMITSKGEVTKNSRQAHTVSKQEVQDTLNLMTNSSLYTLEEELRSGYLTLSGGHRVGLVGQVIRDRAKIKRIKHIAALNIRFCQEVIGAANGVINQIINGSNDIYNTLIISPPRCGKTTLLRDLVRQISNGIPKQFNGLKVGVVDERSEIGGAYQGVAQNQIGIRTDLLDRAPKPEGILLLIRSMSPNVIVTDEIGTKEDVDILLEALNAGVRVITTVHGSNLAEVKSRPSLAKLFKDNIFKRIIILSRAKGPGTIEKIIKY